MTLTFRKKNPKVLLTLIYIFEQPLLHDILACIPAGDISLSVKTRLENGFCSWTGLLPFQ